MVKNLPENARDTRDVVQVLSLSQEYPSEEARQPAPVFLAGETHGQKNLVGSGPQNYKGQTRLK